MRECNTFDLLVLDVGAQWHNKQSEDTNKEPTQDDLLAMIDNVKKQNANNEE